MENWRRTRNEDGSGDGPSSSGSMSGPDIAGWRSGVVGGSTNAGFGTNSHRWGQSITFILLFFIFTPTHMSTIIHVLLSLSCKFDFPKLSPAYIVGYSFDTIHATICCKVCVSLKRILKNLFINILKLRLNVLVNEVFYMRIFKQKC